LPFFTEKSHSRSYTKSLLANANLKTGYNYISYSGNEVFKKGSFILLTSEFSRQEYFISVEKSNSDLTDYNIEYLSFDYKRFTFNQYIGKLIDSYNQFALSKIFPNELDSYRFVFNVQLLKPITITKLNVDFKKKFSNSGDYNLIISTNSSDYFIKSVQVYEGNFINEEN
jgi:hypothetical protein